MRTCLLHPRRLVVLLACAVLMGAPARVAAQVSDLNGDGHPDIIWQDVENGWVAAWLMNGTTIIDSILLYPLRIPPGTSSAPAWRIVGTGDVDGDGKADLFWQDQYSMYTAVWLMDGTSVQDSVLHDRQPGAGEFAAMVSDVNGDGRVDFITRYWLMRWPTAWFTGLGTSSGMWALFPVNLEVSNRPDWNWKMVGAADFDADGRKEYIWWNAYNGTVMAWACEGPEILAEIPLGIVEHPSWRIAGVGDFNGDGKPDLLWQNETWGRLAVSYMNGLSIVSSELIPSGIISSNWQVVGKNHRWN